MEGQGGTLPWVPHLEGFLQVQVNLLNNCQNWAAEAGDRV